MIWYNARQCDCNLHIMISVSVQGPIRYITSCTYPHNKKIRLLSSGLGYPPCKRCNICDSHSHFLLAGHGVRKAQKRDRQHLLG
ncbi:hypothetical protein GDO86_015831 [Hymenochirus boettgeri]|uniref:Uncharacterized protein n=1 Tax=Hymenochirus boettgeri TaxID=247094 RepID=A0A8T2K2N1_9PIPI|nr:hypothetical protein GDO86_015831 [Hymenochirus boettgeri]